MNTLPYELLQHVASSLLPRYQCRLALTSKHHYKYLYSYLLRWHARKHSIPLPIHDTIDSYGKKTLLFTGKSVIIYNNLGGIFGRKPYNSFNTSNLSTRDTVGLVHGRKKVKYIDYEISIQALYNIITHLPKEYINKYSKYLHKDIFLILVNRRSLPHLDRVDGFIFDRIHDYLSDEDIDNIASCDHLFLMLAG